MATEFSDIYLDGINYEELYADGGQIVEAWLNGECIWKLMENYLKTVIHYITWYDGMYYAVGQVYTKEDVYNQWFPSIFIGETIENLKAYRQSIPSGSYVPMTDYSRGWGINDISCDKNGVWIGRETYRYAPGFGTTGAERMSLHSGFEFVDQEKEYFFDYFADNNILNIPKSKYGTLCIGNDLYIARPASTNPVTSGVYKYVTSETITLETLEGHYEYIFNLGENAYIVLGNNSFGSSEYIWEDVQNTPNPNCKFPIMQIRSLPEWGNEGNVYFPLREIYQILKNKGETYISGVSVNVTEKASNDECVIGIIHISYGGTNFYAIFSFDGSDLKQKIFTKYPFESGIRSFGNIEEMFYCTRRIYANGEETCVMRIFDSIDNMLNAKEFFIDRNYESFDDAFIKDNFLYLIDGTYNPDIIVWLKINLETLETLEETVKITSK